MKKASLIFSTLLLALVLGGCSKGGEEKTIGEQDPNSAKESQQLTGEIATGGENEPKEEGNILNKLKSAVTSGKKMKCVYKIENEGKSTEIVSYMQGDKYRSEIDMGAIKTRSVFDGDVMYSWTEGQKQGMKMTMDCMESLGGETAAGDNKEEEIALKDGDDFVESLKDAQNLSCEDADDIDFSIPSDIEFTDQCEMLKSQQELMEKFKQ